MSITAPGIVRLVSEAVINLFMEHTPLMRTSVSLPSSLRPAEIVSPCPGLYFRFALSFRDVEQMSAMRGVLTCWQENQTRTLFHGGK